MLGTSRGSTENSARQLLEQELQCFQLIMKRTQDILDESDSTSLNIILDLLDARDIWISELKALEERRGRLKLRDPGAVILDLQERIAQHAKSLVVTDAKLLDILQIKRTGVVKELGKLAENKDEVERTKRRNQEPRLIDTRRA